MLLVLSTLLFWSFSANCQDERFIRDIFTPESFKKGKRSKKALGKKYSWVVASPLYQIDLNDDKFAESIQVQKRDGADWLVILGDDFSLIHQSLLQTWGKGSYLYKIQIANLSNRFRILICYFYQGYNGVVNGEGSAKIYFVSIDNNNLNSIKLFAGPSVFEEKNVNRSRHYHLRLYRVTLFDYNRDGIKEVKVRFGQISRIYFYLGKGKWKTL